MTILTMPTEAEAAGLRAEIRRRRPVSRLRAEPYEGHEPEPGGLLGVGIPFQDHQLLAGPSPL